MAKNVTSSREPSLLAGRGSAIVEYVVATSMALGALLVPMGADNHSVLQRLIEAIQREHAGYLYAASVPSLPRGSLGGSEVAAGDADGSGDAPGGDDFSGDPSDSGSEGSPAPGNSAGQDNGTDAWGESGGDAGSAGNGSPDDVADTSAPDTVGDDPLAHDDLADKGTDGDAGNGEGSCPFTAADGSETATNSAFTSASQRTGVMSTQVGNPIHVVTGNKYQREVDVTLPALHLAFVRHYNSRSSHRGSLGSGWTHGFDVRLSERDDQLVLWQADGRRIDFRLDRDHDGTRRFRPAQHGDGLFSADRGGYEWHWRDRTVLGFDRNRRLRQIRDDQGRTLRLVRDSGGRLLRLVNEAGDSLSLHHDAQGRIDALTTPEGVTARYAYDDKDNLVRVEYPGKGIRRYHYDDPGDVHNLTGISVGTNPDALQRIKTWAYDAQDRGVLYRPEKGDGQIELAFEDGRTRVTDSRKRSSLYFGDVRNGIPIVARIEGPGCSPCMATRASGAARFEYDERANLVGLLSADGGSRRYERDALGRIVLLTDSTNDGRPASKLRFSYWRDTDEVETVARDSIKPGAEHTIRLRYRDDGQIEERIETGFAPLPGAGYVPIQRSQRVTYTGDRLDAIEAFRPGSAAMVRVLRDVEAGTLDMTFADGGVLRVLRWDERGRPRVLQADDQTPLELHYGATGRIEAMTSHRGRLELQYGPQGQLVGIRGPGGVGKRIHLRKRHTDALAIQAANSEVRTHQRPSALELFALARPRPGLHPVTDGRGTSTIYGVDDFGRRVFTQSPDTGVTSYDYDEDNHLLSKTTASNATAHFLRDGENRLIEIRTSDQVARFDWTSQGAASRVSAIHTTEGTEQTVHDDTGRVIRKVDMVGTRRYVTEYRYASHGKLESKRLPDGRVLEYRYRARGSHPPELAEIVERRWMRKLPVVREVQLADPSIGHRTERWAAGNGTQTSLTWERGLLARLRIDALHDFTYGHDAQGRIVRIDDRNEVAARYRFDARGRLEFALTPSALTGYRYDSNGNRTGIVINGHSVEYGYRDQGNQLAVVDRRTVPWQPPMRFGVQAVVDGTSREPPPLLKQNSNAVETAALPAQILAHHAVSGEVTRLGALRLHYNANGQIADVWRGARHLARYRYNVRAQRVAKQIPGTASEQHFLYENGRLAGEADANGTIRVQYLYLGQRPVALLTEGSTYFIHTNHLGAPIAVTDAARTVIWVATYTPFGRATVDEDPDRDGRPFTFNLRLPGQYEDAETGLHYNHHRYYDPDMGRYLSPDPLGLAAGPNPYVYGGNDPVNHIDPTGLLLFAFDGTGNNDPPLGKRDISNVVKFRDAYLGDPGELGVRSVDGVQSDQHHFYISGAGTTDARTGISGDAYYDALTGSSMIDRVAALADDFFDHMAWLYLNHQKSLQVNVDTIGFSRGAAQARVFTNLLTAFLNGEDDFVLDHSSGRRYDFSFGDPEFARKYMQESCIDVNLRFMGLFDTVPHYSAGQFHLEAAGISQDDDLRQLDLGVGEADDPNAMHYVAHAVAANEDRQGFHAISIHPHPLKGNTESRMEMGFIGAHADIGGGYAEGDLPDVALMWMVKRAEAAGVAMSYGRKRVQLTEVTSPVIHDSKDSKPFFLDGRQFKYTNGVDQVSQRRWYDNFREPNAYGMDYAVSTDGFFRDQYRSGLPPMRGTKDNEGNSTLVGLIDGPKYSEWLKANYGIDIPINETGLNGDRRPLPAQP
jgi:RHS repeat-associated protein